jgi:DNA-binding transcriptional LysR family regulator
VVKLRIFYSYERATGNDMSINWDDMKYFLALCRKGTFLAAAAELKVTHSTVARRISTLEESLQTRLFNRNERGCRLTLAGEKLIRFAEQMESTAINFEESISGKNKELSGVIRIGAPDGLGNIYLPQCLGKLQAENSRLEVELIAVPRYYSLSKREIDILITVKKPQAGNIVVRRLTTYRLGIFASENYLRQNPQIDDLANLREQRIIGYIDDLLFDPDLQFMEEISPGLTPQFRSTTVLAQMRAVASGAGIGVIPYFMAHNEKGLIPVLPETYIERSYWLQVHPDSRQLARVRATINFLAAQIESDKHLFQTLPES